MAHMERPVRIGGGVLHYDLLVHPPSPGIVCQGLVQDSIQERSVHEEVEVGAGKLHLFYIAEFMGDRLVDLSSYGGRALLEDRCQAEGH